MERVVITGAGRGIGLEFCRQFARQGFGVVAVTRNVAGHPSLQQLVAEYPETLHLKELDVTDFSAVVEFGMEISGLPVDILVNNAGQIGPESHKGEFGQTIGKLDYSVLRELFELNALAPLHMTECLVPSLSLSGRPRVFVLGSTVGCASETFGEYYGYRMSKAAAHIAFATLAKDLATRNISAAVLCPGWVRTDMGGPSASLSAEDSVRMMADVITRFSESQRGKFLSFDGRELAY